MTKAKEGTAPEGVTVTPEQLQDMIARAVATELAKQAPPQEAPPEPFTQVRLEGTAEPVRVDDLTAPLPERRFRDAWRLDGTVVRVDMGKARQLARERIRQARKPELERLDIAVVRAIETAGDPGIPGRAKQRLRDATKDPRLDEAKDPEALAAAVDEIVSDMQVAQ